MPINFQGAPYPPDPARLTVDNTFSGQIQLDSTQAATDANSAMTRGLADTRYGSIQMAYRTTNATKTNDTTIADDDVLILSLDIGVYEIDMAIWIECTGGTSGSKMTLAFTGVSDAVKTGGILYLGSGGNNTGSAVQSPSRPVTNGASRFTFPRAIWANNAVYNSLQGKLIMHVTTAGTLSVQWAQNSSTASPTMLYASTFLKARNL